MKWGCENIPYCFRAIVLIEFSPELTNVNIDKLMEKFLLLENVDFVLSTKGRMVTDMVDHQDKPDDKTKDNN